MPKEDMEFAGVVETLPENDLKPVSPDLNTLPADWAEKQAALNADLKPIIPEAVALREIIDQTVRAWLVENIHGSPVSQSTEAWNHLTRCLDDLIDRLAAI